MKFLLSFVVGLGCVQPFLGQDPLADQFFESRIRPILANNCYQCHTGASSGGLRVDSREALLKGGASGPSVIPGSPSAIQALFSTNSELTTEIASLWAKSLLEAHPTDKRRVQTTWASYGLGTVN